MRDVLPFVLVGIVLLALGTVVLSAAPPGPTPPSFIRMRPQYSDSEFVTVA